MQTWVILFIVMWVAFVVEEFVLIKAVSTVAQSDPLSRRIERFAIWQPGVGMALTGALVGRFGHVWLDGFANGTGVVLCMAGLRLRYWSRRTLGRFFTIGVVKQEGHVVVRQGPYRFVRHPAYLGFMLFYTGLPLVVGSWFGLLVLSLPAAAIFCWLVVVEDRKLEEVLGADYAQYKTQSARLVPGVW